MPVVLLILLAVIVLLAVLIFFVSFRFSQMVIRPKTHTYESMMKEAYEFGRFTPEFIDNLDREAVIIRSGYGYDLHGFILENEISRLPENRNKVAVLCHGYTVGKLIMSQYAAILMDLGFTCIVYDHRNHGDNDKSVNTTMGLLEREDLKTVIDWAIDRFGSSIRIITYGESMGSATVLSHLEIDDRPVLTIADCGYSSLRDLSEYLLKESYHLPVWPILPLARLILKITGPFDIRDVCPEKGVIATDKPILFIHGTKDTFVPTRMSVEMSKLGNGPRELYLCEGAVHAQSAVIDPVRYRETVSNFINKYY